MFNEFLKYAILNILGMIGLSCYILADTFFIAQGIGADGLTALNLAIPVYSFIHGSGLMLGIGGAARYSILKGQREQEGANRLFTNVIWLAGFFAAVFIFCGMFFAGKIAVLLGADEAVLSMTSIYLKVILLFSPAFMMNNVILCFVRNDDNPKLSMLAMLGGSLFNIVLDYILIFPCHLGILGAVLATGASPVVSLLILSFHFKKKQQGFHLKKTVPLVKTTVNVLATGFPSLVTELSSGIVIIVFNILMLKFEGNVGVAAYSVIANLSLVVISIYTGLAQGVQPLFSRFYGQGDKKGMKQILRYAVVSVVGISVVVYAFCFFFTSPMVAAFNSEQNMQLQSIAEAGMKLYFTAIALAGFNIVLSMYFAAKGTPLPAHIITLMRGLVVMVPMAYLLSAAAGVTGLWLTFPVTEGIVTVLAIVLYRKQKM